MNEWKTEGLLPEGGEDGNQKQTEHIWAFSVANAGGAFVGLVGLSRAPSRRTLMAPYLPDVEDGLPGHPTFPERLDALGSVVPTSFPSHLRRERSRSYETHQDVEILPNRPDPGGEEKASMRAPRGERPNPPGPARARANAGRKDGRRDDRSCRI